MLIFTDGFELDFEALEETQFRCPILVLNSEGLDLKVPPNSFSIQDVEDHIGNLPVPGNALRIMFSAVKKHCRISSAIS